MKKKYRGLLFSILLGLAGCVEIETVIRVSPDGSGTVSEKMILSSAVVEQLQALTAELGNMSGMAGNDASGEFDMFGRDRLERRAASLGEGVTLDKVESLSTDWGEGYRATYNFSSIETLRIDQNPSGAIPTGPALEPVAQEVLTFDLEKGKTATLKVFMPEADQKGSIFNDIEEAEGESFPPEEDPEQVEAQMKEMFRDLHVSVAIEIDGEIVETNASHRDDARITLMELDFSKLLENPEKFEAMQSTQPQSLEEAKQIMAGIPGVRVELEREVQVTFK